MAIVKFDSSFEDLLEEIIKYDTAVVDHIVPYSGVSIDEKGNICFAGVSGKFAPRRTFLQDVALKCGSLNINRCSGIFLENLKDHSTPGTAAFANIMNFFFSEFHNRFKRRNSDKAKFRCLTPVEGIATTDCVRALVSPNYNCNNSHFWITTTLQKLLPKNNMQRVVFDGDTLKGSLVIKDTLLNDPSGDLSASLVFTQGEIGNCGCSISPAAYSKSLNSWIEFGVPWRVSHTSRLTLPEIESDLIDAINKKIPIATAGANQFLLLRKKALTDDQAGALILYISRNSYNIDDSLKRKWFSEFRADGTNTAYSFMFSLVSAVGSANLDLQDTVSATVANFLLKDVDKLVNSATVIYSVDLVKEFFAPKV